MILRNIHNPLMMNGTRAIIVTLYDNLIEAKISTGDFKNQLILLPRIKFKTDESKTALSFTRL